jgi:DNA-3-methyladenine glycosylase
MGRHLTAPLGLLPREFFDRPVLEVAPDLLGCVLRHETADGPVAVLLTEVEAYLGEADPASHAYRGMTARNAVMFGEPGHAYVYFTYGMHFCVNLVCLPPGTAGAVLLRAGRVTEGTALATARRSAERDLARGPARLCQAMGIDRALDGADVCSHSSPLQITRRAGAEPPVTVGPRIGISRGAEEPWRFWITGDPAVSAYRPHVPRRRATGG